MTELMNKIRHYNELYRTGESPISDEEYDDLLETLSEQMPQNEFEEFLVTLTDEGGDVVHAYAVGSLKKLKYDAGQLIPWLKKHLITLLLLMAKIDGISYVATYVDGVLVKGATKGRKGGTGKDITAKLRHILPTRLPRPLTMDIRGELTLTGDSFIALGFKNRRVGTVGMIKREGTTVEDLKHITAYAYQIKLGHMADASVSDQLLELKSLGFNLPEFMPNVVVSEIPESEIEKQLADILLKWRSSASHDMDGLVLCSMDYQVEDVELPEQMVSFKVNQDAIPATVTGIEWGISKNGRMTPVVQITPLEIDGSTVRQATGYNAQWLLDRGVGVGASVGIIKSGEIIPKITEIYTPATVDLPKICPSCGMELTMNGVDLACDNDECGAVGVKEAESFLIKLDIEGAKAQTLENLGIRSMTDLLEWRPDPEYKSQTKLYSEILTKIFNAPADRLFAALLFDGFGRKMVNRLMTFYGSRLEATAAIRTAASSTIPADFVTPEGFTSLNMSKARSSWEQNLEILGRICADLRYQEPEAEIAPVAGDSLKGKSFLVTGTLSVPRKEIENLIVANGGTLASGVSKKLNFLIAGSAAGSKLEKAQSLGVPVLDETAFMAMLESTPAADNDVMVTEHTPEPTQTLSQPEPTFQQASLF